jgi:endonuclease YncB( thermonuclease family)
MTYAFQPPSLRAQCIRVVDGDTIDVFVDCGFREFKTMRLRLAGINAPEMHSKDATERLAAQAAKMWLTSILYADDLVLASLAKPSPVGEWPLRLITYKDPDSFGRWIADVFIHGDDGEISINAMALDLGHAKPYVKGK